MTSPALTDALLLTSGLLLKLAAFAGGVWATIQVYDRVVVRVKIKTHPGVFFRRPHHFEDAYRVITEQGGNPERIFVQPAEPLEYITASAQPFRPLPPDARDDRAALFVRVYNYSPKRHIKVVRVWFDGFNNQQIEMDGPKEFTVPPEDYRETWIYESSIPPGIAVDDRYRRVRAEVLQRTRVLGRRAPLTSTMASGDEVGASGDVLAAPAMRDRG